MIALASPKRTTSFTVFAKAVGSTLAAILVPSTASPIIAQPLAAKPPAVATIFTAPTTASPVVNTALPTSTAKSVTRPIRSCAAKYSALVIVVGGGAAAESTANSPPNAAAIAFAPELSWAL